MSSQKEVHILASANFGKKSEFKVYYLMLKVIVDRWIEELKNRKVVARIGLMATEYRMLVISSVPFRRYKS